MKTKEEYGSIGNRLQFPYDHDIGLIKLLRGERIDIMQHTPIMIRYGDSAFSNAITPTERVTFGLIARFGNIGVREDSGVVSKMAAEFGELDPGKALPEFALPPRYPARADIRDADFTDHRFALLSPKTRFGNVRRQGELSQRAGRLMLRAGKRIARDSERWLHADDLYAARPIFRHWLRRRAAQALTDAVNARALYVAAYRRDSVTAFVSAVKAGQIPEDLANNMCWVNLGTGVLYRHFRPSDEIIPPSDSRAGTVSPLNQDGLALF